MNSGWCWQIEHDHRINRGYVYSSAFISDGEAEQEFRLKNPKVGPTRVVRFVSGYYERAWEKNVVAIGNSAGFVEPLESTALFVICDEAWGLAQSLADSDLNRTKHLPKSTTSGVARHGRAYEASWASITNSTTVWKRRSGAPARRRPTWATGPRSTSRTSRNADPPSSWIDTLLQGRDVFGL